MALILTNANDIEKTAATSEELDQTAKQNISSPIKSFVEDFHLAPNRRK